MTTPSDSRSTLDVWSALVNVYQEVLHDVVRDLEARAQMDSGVFSVLAHLARSRPAHRMPMRDLQQAMYPRYSQPGFSRLVQRMEVDGLVTRHVDPNDGRAVLVVTTDAGRARYRNASGVYEASVRRHFGRHVPGARAEEFARLLEGVATSRASTA